jgi:acetyl-CoA carboxylase carboxyl transferase subunit beta
VHALVEEWDRDLASADPLAFPGYRAQLDELGSESPGGPGRESVRTGRTAHYVLVENRFEVFGGSMGVVAGERIARAVDRATTLGLPVVCVTCSGGARLQEGMVALVQMGRTAAALRRHGDARLLSLAVHRSPTTGGVFASYGSLCDLRAVEVGALIGFAGPRVVAATTGGVIDGRSHTAATALAHGLVDAAVAGSDITAWVEGALGLRDMPLAPRPRSDLGAVAGSGPTPEPSGTDAWTEVLRSRHPGRPSGIDVAARLCRSWTELGGTDPTVRAGLATIGVGRAVVVASDRYAGAGQPTAAGFRLAQRAIALADRLALPVVTLVDTPGADPSSASENDGLAAEIARTFAALAGLSTVSVSVCVGEGGSGGALALAWADRLLVQEHAIFSVIGPEGAAAILERDASKAPEVASRLGLTSGDLQRLGVVDGVVGESIDDVTTAVSQALAEATTGDRDRRADALSCRWLTGADAILQTSPPQGTDAPGGGGGEAGAAGGVGRSNTWPG